MTKHYPPLVALGESNAAGVRQSFAQSRLWFLHQMAPERAQHNIVTRMTLSGVPLDAARLEQALNAVCQRHSVLRSCYRTTADGQEQWVPAAFRFHLETLDLTPLPPQSRDSALQQYMRDDLAKAFDLERGPVWRASLVDIDAQRQELIITLHHIAFDGRSGEILLLDLMHAYAEPPSGVASPAPLQYGDFAAWEPHYMTPTLIAEEVAFWRDHLAGMPVQLAFADRPRPAGPAKAGRHAVALPADLVERLKKAARAQRQPLFVLLATLFNVWLRYVSGQSRFLVGTDVHGRDLPELADIFGFFVNQLTLTCELADDTTLAELLVQTRHSIRQAHAHRQLPFDLLVSHLAPQRQADRSPLFQVKFNYQRDRFCSHTFGDARITHTQVLQDLAGFDLVLDLMHRRDEIEATLEYNQHLFGAEEIERLSAVWLHLLDHLDGLLDQPIEALCEHLQRWNDAHLHQQQSQQARQSRTRLASTVRRTVSL
ncbi:condensation domain-containing protein [Pseudomonas sp. GD03944]|uniref:condensation domain-containing protein n=1 Tax=Pseudomonas sp. GD03944 TaxID=2975409 RepID=UPI00244BFEAE|nr:condensation domain-containing protein [Pseudomonas sp. GD03944]MDH1265246.1 condensation domain-containing protein [Pseudomonas sp. GD03944]